MARRLTIIAAMMVIVISQAMAYTAPWPAEAAAYKGLHAAAVKDDGPSFAGSWPSGPSWGPGTGSGGPP